MPNIQDVVDAQRQWNEILRSHPDRVEAAAMGACERFSESFQRLAKNLVNVGYPMEPAIRTCSDGLDGRISKLERAIEARVPDVLVHFWKKVGGASVVDLENYAHVRFWADTGVDSELCDGFHVDPCDDEWLTLAMEEYAGWKRHSAQGAMQIPFWLSLAPDGFHKDNISGGPPGGVQLDSEWAPSCSLFAWSGATHPRSALGEQMDFVGCLRTAILECAGFPGLLGDSAFEKIRAQLLDGVPIF